MQAFYNKPELKAQAIAEMQAHIAADQLIKGKYWEDGKGCFIGCAVKTRGKGHWHDTFQELYNIDKRLSGLFDVLFEGAPNERAMRWPIEVYSAIQVGADLSKVADEFQYWLLSGDDSPIAFSFKGDDWGVWNATKGVAALYAERLAGNEPSYGAWSAAWAAAGAALDAAWAAAGAAGDAAKAASFIKMADKLLELLAAAPINESVK